MTASRRLPFWAISLMLVVGLHAALFFWALYWQPPVIEEAPPAAMLVELAPLPVPAAAKPVAPQVVQPEEPEPLPKLLEAPKPRLAITPPKPKPKPKPRPQPPKPVEPVVKPAEEAPNDAPAELVSKAEDKPAAPQPAASSAPSAAEVSWQSRLLSHLAKYKRYPDDARRRGIEGATRLRFVVDAKGKVVEHSLVGRSGSRSLDHATLQMIRRAQPLPVPPADMLKDGSVVIVTSFIYALERN